MSLDGAPPAVRKGVLPESSPVSRSVPGSIGSTAARQRAPIVRALDRRRCGPLSLELACRGGPVPSRAVRARARGRGARERASGCALRRLRIRRVPGEDAGFRPVLATIEGEFAGKNFGFTELVWERGCGKEKSFLRGDVTGGGKRNARDLNLLAAHLFQRAALPCEDSADVDDNGMVDAADLVYLTSWLLRDGEPPLPPSDLRGPDPTDDGLNCAW
jgi:hypothetical protein